MTLELEVTLKVDGKKVKHFSLNQTNEGGKRKDGKAVLLHFQPASSCTVIKPFSKLYVDGGALKAK